MTYSYDRRIASGSAARELLIRGLHEIGTERAKACLESLNTITSVPPAEIHLRDPKVTDESPFRVLADLAGILGSLRKHRLVVKIYTGSLELDGAWAFRVRRDQRKKIQPYIERLESQIVTAILQAILVQKFDSHDWEGPAVVA